MKKIFLSIFTMAAMAACKPEMYTGPLDSPVGSWDGVKTDYYFNGEPVGEADECEFSAISFYEDGLCCIEGVKGALPYMYDHASGQLVIGTTHWSMETLTGAEMVMKYLESDLSKNATLSSAVAVPVEYKGVTINADNYGYFYEDGQGDKTYCNYHGTKDEAGALVIDFWYDQHIDHFIPLVVEAKK